MWTSNRRRVIITNILLALLIVAILAGLYVVIQRVNQQTQKHDEELTEIYLQQQQQQTEARQESVAAIQAEYEKDMQTVAEYLPGIVCWGDSMTMGSSGNISYPAVLKTCLDTYFCDIYDFRSTIENAGEYGRLKWDEYKVDVPVVNMGAGLEDSYTVLGRAGAMPYVLSRDLNIPAETTPVEVKFTAENGKRVSPLKGGDVGVNNVHIGDVEGRLTIETDPYYGGYRYYFTRLEEGEATSAPAGTVVETAASSLYRDYIHVVCIGTYGSFASANDLINQIKLLLARQTKNTDRYLVLGLCSIYNSTSNTYQLNEFDTALLQAFGNHYVNVRKYLVEDGMADAGLTPSGQDTYYMTHGTVPVSFTTSSLSIELNGKALAVIGKLVYNRMESLGYFDEVYDELNIKETTKQILKDDPEYFDRIIKNAIK